METIAFKAPDGTKRRLARLARERGLTTSSLTLFAVERELASSKRGALLGAGRALTAGPSRYDPDKPAIPPEEWGLAT